MKAYPEKAFRLTEGERVRITALGECLRKVSADLPGNMIFSLTQCERGNATMHAFDGWCGREGYASRSRRDLAAILAELDEAFSKPRDRARRILRKRIRKQRPQAA